MIHTGKFKRMEIYHNTKGETPEAIKAKTGCTAILNGVLFNGDSSLCCDVRIDGKWIANDQWTYWGLGWSGNDVPKTVHTNDAEQYDNYLSCVDVSPTIKRGRTAIGFRGDAYAALCVSDASEDMTIPAVRSAMETLCDAYLVLDGGGSAYLDCPSGKVDTSLTRKKQNRTYLLIWEVDSSGKEEKKMKICLDPGHGGTDVSNGSPDGSYKEHEFTLDLALRIKPMLERHGVEVVLTRETNTSVSLPQRAVIANSEDADLFCALHSNAVAINSVSDPDGDGYGDVEGLTAWILKAGGERERAAKLILEEMAASGVKLFGSQLYTANFAVLSRTSMPAVLIEYGFHTTKADIVRLKSTDYRQTLAEATAKGLIRWCGLNWIPAPQSKPAEILPDSYYTVQFGAFVQEDNAKAMKELLAKAGYNTIIKEVKV